MIQAGDGTRGRVYEHSRRLPVGLRAACENMDFEELRSLLDASLDGLAEGRPLKDGPRSKREFAALLGVLREKAKELPTLPPVQPSLVPNPAKGRFKPSEELLAWRVERNRLRAALRRRRMVQKSKPASSRTSDAGCISRSRRRSLEAQERKEYEAAMSSYREAKATYEAALRRRKAAESKRDERLRNRRRIVENLGRRIERAFDPSGIASLGYLHWVLLPLSRRARNEVLAYHEALRRERWEERYDPERRRALLEAAIGEVLD